MPGVLGVRVYFSLLVFRIVNLSLLLSFPIIENIERVIIVQTYFNLNMSVKFITKIDRIIIYSLCHLCHF